MKRIGTIFLCCFVALATACTPKGIIPKKKLAAINADFYLMDQYLGAERDMRRFTDTVAVYKPILRSYGYTADDYFASVNYYMENSRDMAKVLDMTEKILKKREQKILRHIDKQAHKADSTSPKKLRIRKKGADPDSLILDK